MEERGPAKRFLQGMIQIAVGYHHALNGNYKGASSLFTKGIPKLLPYLPSCESVPLGDLVPVFERHRLHFTELLGGKAGDFDGEAIPLIQLA